MTEPSSHMLDDDDIALLVARVKALSRQGTDSAYGAIGRDLKPYLDEPEAKHLPEPIQLTLRSAMSNEGTGARMRDRRFSDKEVGKRFMSIYRKKLHESLCKEDGELYQLFTSEGGATNKALIVGLAGTLGVGSAFAGIVCGIASILLGIGLRAFCDLSDDPSSSKQ